MRRTKLNKSQNWELILNAINNAVAETKTLKKGTESKFTDELLLQLDFLKPKQGGGTSTKVNEAGEVYCNYFEQYLPASEFNTKLGKPNKETGERTEGYKANSRDAEVIIRKIKSIKLNVTKQATEAFRAKYMGEEEYNSILDKMDEVAITKYDSLHDVPTVADIIGLTEALAGSNK